MSSSKPSTRVSPFFRDLASPVSSHHRAAGGRFTAYGHAAAISSLWKESSSSPSADPPPPPVFTLDDRADFSPEPGLGDFPLPSSGSGSFSRSRTPPRLDRRGSLSPSPSLSSSSFVLRRAKATGSGVVANGGVNSPEGSSWLTPIMVGGTELDRDRGFPVDGMVESRALITLPPPREGTKPELPRNGTPSSGKEGEEWITVFGFSPRDTNLVLREFEKCGVILKHVPGPRDANWIHILYQNHYDAQKALEKNGSQLNCMLIVGVKVVDPIYRAFLSETLNKCSKGGFMVSLPSKSAVSNGSADPSSSGTCPHTSTTTISDSGRRRTGAIATPSNSIVSKVMDLMFGI